MKNDISDAYLAIFTQYYADIDAAESTSDRRVTGGGFRWSSPGCRCQDASVALFTAIHSVVGVLFIHSIVRQLLLLAMFKIDFFVSRGCGYMRSVRFAT